MSQYTRHAATAAEGDAVDPIVLIGSLGSTAVIWDHQIPTLRQHADVLVLEHRGHGGAVGMPPPQQLDDLVADLLQVLDAEGIARANLVGVSLGGMLSLRMASSHPERVARVAVMCTSAAFDAPEFWHARADLVLAQGPGAVAADIVSRWFTPPFAKAQPALVEHMIAMITGTEPAGYAGCCRAIAEMDLRPELPHVGAEVLAIAATGDHTTPLEHLRTIAELTPGSHYVEVPGAHLVNVEAAAMINDLLVRHLTGGFA